MRLRYYLLDNEPRRSSRATTSAKTATVKPVAAKKAKKVIEKKVKQAVAPKKAAGKKGGKKAAAPKQTVIASESPIIDVGLEAVQAAKEAKTRKPRSPQALAAYRTARKNCPKGTKLYMWDGQYRCDNNRMKKKAFSSKPPQNMLPSASWVWRKNHTTKRWDAVRKSDIHKKPRKKPTYKSATLMNRQSRVISTLQKKLQNAMDKLDYYAATGASRRRYRR
jgi:hypothetical protein